MGNNINMSSSASSIDPSDYHLVGKVSTIRWGEVSEMKNSKTGQKVFMQEKFSNDLQTHQKNIEECSTRLSLSHSNLASLLGFSQSDTPEPSNNKYKMCLYFEHMVTNLSDLLELRIAQRRATKKPMSKVGYFDESELLRFLNQLVDVLSYLQMNDINLGDITPDVCFISEHGNIKILDKSFLFDDRSAFDLIRQGVHNVFATPGELKALENGFGKTTENRYKADLFRLGMTLVECATLQESADVYDWRTQTISVEDLSARLVDIKGRYSDKFYNIVREMLRFDETKRLDFLTLNQRLQEEAAISLDATLAKNEENHLRSPEVNRLKVASPLSSKQNDLPGLKSPSHRSPFQETDFTRHLKVQYQGSIEKERGREKEKSDKNKNDDNLNNTQEFGSAKKISNNRYNESRLSAGNLQIPENLQERPTNMTNLTKMAHQNFDFYGSQEAAKKSAPNISRDTPSKDTPSKHVKIFTPVKNPEALQNNPILSPTDNLKEHTKQSLPYTPPKVSHTAPRMTAPVQETPVQEEEEEQPVKIYSPFNHRPSRSDVTSSPSAKQKANFENFSNIQPIGRSTYPLKNPETETRISPEKQVSQNNYSPKNRNNSMQYNQPPASMFSSNNYYNIRPQSTTENFAPLNNSRLTEQSQYQDPILSFGNFEESQPERPRREFVDSFQQYLGNPAPVYTYTPLEVREERPVSSGFSGNQFGRLPESPKSFEVRDSLPRFGVQESREEPPRVFGMSTKDQLRKELKESPIRAPVVVRVSEDEDKSLNINDRFERAMQRSKRSEGFVKEMSKSLSKSPLRKD